MKEKERAEGIEQGIEQGMEKGMKKGMEQGIEKGIEQGMEKGMEKGKAVELIDNIETLKLSLKISLEQAAAMLGKTMQDYKDAQELLMKKEK